MSAYTFPDLPGLDIAVEHTIEQPETTIHRMVSGKEYRTSWGSTPTHRFKLKFNVVREYIDAPEPNQAFNEVSVLAAFLSTHQGRLDTFLYNGPDGVQYTVRFNSDSLSLRRIADQMWECELELISVL